MMGISGLGNVNTSYKPILNPGQSTEVTPGRKSSPAECETCKNRKYQDGSDEMVSFKSAAHISPQASAARVRAHEQEHVSNAYKSAAQNNGQVLRLPSPFARQSARNAAPPIPQAAQLPRRFGIPMSPILISRIKNPPMLRRLSEKIWI